MIQRIFVTGANGYIGSRLVPALFAPLVQSGAEAPLAVATTAFLRLGNALTRLPGQHP